MKKNATMLVIATALIVIAGFAVSAFSEDVAKTPATMSTAAAPAAATTATTTNCPSTCPKFVDNNKDGVCDSMAVHHADGTTPAQCPYHNTSATTTTSTTNSKVTMPAGCDPTKCMSHPGSCPMKTKGACPGHK